MTRWISLLEPLTGSHTAALDLKMGAAPVWQQNTDNCQACAVKFTLTTRTHHCRHCGRCVCDKCSRRRIHLRPADRKPSRVCDDCAASFGSVVGVVGGGGPPSVGTQSSKGSGVKGKSVSMRVETAEPARGFMDELASKVSGRSPAMAGAGGTGGSASMRLTTSGSGIRMASSPPRSPRQGSLASSTGVPSPNSFVAAAPVRGGARSPRSPRGGGGAPLLGRARGGANAPPPSATLAVPATAAAASTSNASSAPQRPPPVAPRSPVPQPVMNLPSFESSSDDSFDDSDSDEDAPPLPALPPPARPAVSSTMNLYRAVRTVTSDSTTGRLSLRAGECVQVVEKVSDRVWMGRRGDEEGLFPSDAVEPYASSTRSSRRRSTRHSWKSMEQQLLSVPLPRVPKSAPPTRVSTDSARSQPPPPPRPASRPPRS
jgi:hypothetical protein